MENNTSTVCFTETVCYYKLNYHRTSLQYITQNKLIQKVHSLTGQIITSFRVEHGDKYRTSLILQGNRQRQENPSNYSHSSHASSSAAHRTKAGRAAEGPGGGTRSPAHSAGWQVCPRFGVQLCWDTAGLHSRVRVHALCLPTPCTTTARQQETLPRHGDARN